MFSRGANGRHIHYFGNDFVFYAMVLVVEPIEHVHYCQIVAYYYIFNVQI